MDRTARLWDAATGWPLGAPMNHQNAVHAVAFSPDGKTVLTGGGDSTARLWEAATGRPLGPSLAHQGPVHAVAFSPDGKTVLTGGGGGARLWEAATGRPLGPSLAHEGGLISVAISPDGKTVVTGGRDGTARLWNAATGRLLGPPLAYRLKFEFAFQAFSAVGALAFSPDSKTVLTGGGGGARLWEVATGRPLGLPLAHQGPVPPVAFRAAGAVAFSPDGKTVLTGGGDSTARLWDVASGQPLGPPLPHQGPVLSVAFSPDGKTVLTGGDDSTARLWDAATGRPLGPPLAHRREFQFSSVVIPAPSAVGAVAFSPDSKTVLTGGGDNTARLWDVSELPDNQERIATWVEVITGLELDAMGSVSVLDNTTWRERRQKLETQGGPPTTGLRWSLDPILFGPDPTARATAWIERKRWAEAEAAFDEAVAARPFDTDIRLERARFLADHAQDQKADDDFARAYLLGDREPALLETIVSRESCIRRVAAESAGSAAPLWASRGEWLARRRLWAEAAVACGEAGRLGPENFADRHHQVLALVAAGDRAGLRRTRADMLNRFGRTTAAGAANEVAWTGAMAVSEGADLGEMVRLAELAVKGAPGNADFLNTLGAALYRAGRFAEAVRRLDEAVQTRKGKSLEDDWVFLAMAHHRLGHRDEARRWLDRLRDRRPDPAPGAFWGELQIRLLRAEAEAVVLWDPIFPADPFAY
jgi:WD40 repeat protein